MKRNDRRSDCPTNYAVQSFCDSWSLLIVRDLLFKGKRSFSELLKSEERISTNILANRLKTLCDQDILSKSGDGKSVSYGLTEKGVDLAPMMVEMILWSARYDENTATPEEFVRAAELNRDELLASIREGAARAQ